MIELCEFLCVCVFLSGLYGMQYHPDVASSPLLPTGHSGRCGQPSNSLDVDREI